MATKDLRISCGFPATSFFSDATLDDMFRLGVVFAVIVTQITTELRSDRELHSRCGPDAYACTFFVGPKLEAPCNVKNGMWVLRPTARYVTLIYYTERALRDHERRHVQDMESSVTQHLHRLESDHYMSEADCDRAGKTAAAGFSATMRQLARQSNNRFH